MCCISWAKAGRLVLQHCMMANRMCHDVLLVDRDDTRLVMKCKVE